VAATARWEIAQLNVGRAVSPLDEAPMADFMARLDEINALAERSPGFVWRLQGDSGNNTDYRVSDGDPLFIVNLSVWSSLEDLHAFTYRSDHRTVFARRYEWFERRSVPNTVIWWQPAGTIPDVHDALRRLANLAREGPSPEGFTFKQAFLPPG
jgi:heme-degrading monooxygenase HmoA